MRLDIEGDQFRIHANPKRFNFIMTLKSGDRFFSKTCATPHIMYETMCKLAESPPFSVSVRLRKEILERAWDVL